MFLKKLGRFVGFTGLYLASAAALAATQNVTGSITDSEVPSGQTATISVSYTTSDEVAELNGLGLRVHYDSSKLSFASFAEGYLETDLIIEMPPGVQDDSTTDYDSDSSTDKYVLMAWTSISSDWPGTIPADLFDINLTSSLSAGASTTVNFSASSTSPGYTLSANSVTLTGAVPSTVTKSSSTDNQTGTAGAALSTPFTVTVADSSGNPLQGVSVAFAVATGGGQLSASSANTNSSGQASTTLTLGQTAGSNTVTATVTGIDPVTFTATGSAGAAAAVAVASGDSQTGTAGSAIANPFVVTVSDQYGNAVSGATVAFAVATGGGSVDTASAATNSSGQASTTLTLGQTAGSNTVTATVTGIDPVTFTATGEAGAAAAVAVASGNSQTGTAGSAVTNPFVVTVSDQYGNAVSGATVAFAVATGGGSVDTASAATNSSGQASTTLTLGQTAGSNTVTATVTGIDPVTFTATGEAGTATQINLELSANQASSMQSSSVTLTATIQDQYSNTVTTSSDDVTFSETADASDLGTIQTAVVAASSGVATTILNIADASGGTHSIGLQAAAGGGMGGMTAGTATLNLVPFSIDQGAALNLMAGESVDLTLTGGTSTSWSLGTGDSGTLSAESSSGATYTAGSSVDTVTVTADDTIGGSPVSDSITVSVGTALSSSISDAIGVVQGDAVTLLITGGVPSGTNACSVNKVSGDDGGLTVTSGDCSTLTSVAGKTGVYTVTATDELTYSGTTTSNSVTTANIEVVAAVEAGSTEYLDTNTNNSVALAPTGGTGSYSCSTSATNVALSGSNNCTVTAVSAGDATITVTDASYDNITDTVSVSVNAPLAVTSDGSPYETTSVFSSKSINLGVSGGTSAANISLAISNSPTNSGLTGVIGDYLVDNGSGSYTFTAPSTGAFAGVYTLTLTDATSGLTTPITIKVPLKLKYRKLVSGNYKTAPRMLPEGVNRYLLVNGGNPVSYTYEVLDAAGTVVWSSTGVSTEDGTTAATDESIAVLATKDSDARIQTITPSDVSAMTSFRIRVTSDQADLVAASLHQKRTRPLHVMPLENYTITVTDADTEAAVDGARVWGYRLGQFSNKFGLTTDSTTDANGQVTFSLPEVRSYTFNVLKEGYLFKQVTEAVDATTSSHAVSAAITALPATTVDYTATVDLNSSGGLLVGPVKAIAKSSEGDKVLVSGSSMTDNNDGTYGVTLSVPAEGFTLSKVVVKHSGARTVVKLASACDEVTYACGTFTLKAATAELSDTNKGKMKALLQNLAIASAATQATVPDVALFNSGDNNALTNAASVVIALKPDATTGTASAGTSAVDLTGDNANRPVIQLVKDASGNVLSAPVVYRALDTLDGERVSSEGGTEPVLVGATESTEFSLDDMEVITSVEVEVSEDSLTSDVDDLFVTTKAATIDPDSTAVSKAAMFGGEMLEIDLVALDSAGDVVSVDEGNSLIDSSNGVTISVPVDDEFLLENGYTPETADSGFASGRLVIYTAPTMQDLEAGTNTTTISGATYDIATGQVSFAVSHFSGVGGGYSPPPAVTSGDGGCTVSNGATFDPILPLLLLFSLLYLLRRRVHQG